MGKPIFTNAEKNLIYEAIEWLQEGIQDGLDLDIEGIPNMKIFKKVKEQIYKKFQD